MPSLPPEMIVLLASFAQLFSERIWLHVPVLVAGALLAPDKRPGSSCLRVRGVHIKFLATAREVGRSGVKVSVEGEESHGADEEGPTEGLRGTFEAITGRVRGRGLFGIEEEEDEVARQAKLQRMAERIAEYERGYEGNWRWCPQCGQGQQYKGEASHEVVVEEGTLTVGWPIMGIRAVIRRVIR